MRSRQRRECEPAGLSERAGLRVGAVLWAGEDGEARKDWGSSPRREVRHGDLVRLSEKCVLEIGGL